MRTPHSPPGNQRKRSTSAKWVERACHSGRKQWALRREKTPDAFFPFFTYPLRLAPLLYLRQMHDSGFCVFRGYVSMARFPMLNGFFQVCDPFAQMLILASLQGMLQCGFRM